MPRDNTQSYTRLETEVSPNRDRERDISTFPREISFAHNGTISPIKITGTIREDTVFAPKTIKVIGDNASGRQTLCGIGRNRGLVASESLAQQEQRYFKLYSPPQTLFQQKQTQKLSELRSQVVHEITRLQEHFENQKKKGSKLPTMTKGI